MPFSFLLCFSHLSTSTHATSHQRQSKPHFQPPTDSHGTVLHHLGFLNLFLIVSKSERICSNGEVHEPYHKRYNPCRWSKTLPLGCKQCKDEHCDRYSEGRSYRDRTSPVPFGLLVCNLPLEARMGQPIKLLTIMN